MKYQMFFGLCTLGWTAVIGPTGPAGSSLFPSGTQAFDIRYGILQQFQGAQVQKISSPLAWGKDPSGNLIYLSSNYSLWKAGDSTVQLYASTPLDQNIAAKDLFYDQGYLYYGYGNHLYRVDLEQGQTQTIFLGEEFGSLASKNGILYRSAPLIKKSTDGGLTWSALVLSDPGTLRSCGEQILVLNKSSYSYVDQAGLWQNTVWQSPNLIDLSKAPMVCQNDTMVIQGSQGLSFYKIGSGNSFKTISFNSLNLPAIQSFAMTSTMAYLANDTATWVIPTSTWTNPQRLVGLAMAMGAEPIWQNASLSLVADQNLWNYNSGTWSTTALPSGLSELYVQQGQALALTSQSKIYQLDSINTVWNLKGALPASHTELLNVGRFLLSQGNTSQSYSMDGGLNWQSLGYGDLQSRWFSTPTQLCALIDASRDSLVCSHNWIKKEIPAVVSSNTPTISTLGETFVLADGYSTWTSPDTGNTWQKYGSISQPQIAQVMELGNQKLLAIAATPGWRQSSDLWARARIGFLSSVDHGQTWQTLQKTDTSLWTLTPAIQGDTVYLASVSGDVFSWSLTTGQMLGENSGNLTPTQIIEPNLGVHALGQGWYNVEAPLGETLLLMDVAGHLVKNWKQNQSEVQIKIQYPGVYYLQSGQSTKIIFNSKF